MSTQSEETGINYMTDTRPIAAGEVAPGCKKRDPIVVSNIFESRPKAVDGLPITYGARVMLSVPPAM